LNYFPKVDLIAGLRKTVEALWVRFVL
jgi:hypothetical protein